MTKRKNVKGNSVGRDAAPGSTPLQAQQDRKAADLPEVQVPKQVQDFWQKASEVQKAKLLSFDQRLLYARAAYVKEQPELSNTLTKACNLLRSDGHCKRWRWQAHGQAFDHPTSLRRYIETKVLPADLASCVKHPRIQAALSNNRAGLTGSTEALHQRLKGIQQAVAAFKLSQQELCKEKPWTVVRESAVLNLICQHLVEEHAYLHSAFACPIQHWLWDLKPPSLRSREPHSDSCFEYIVFQLIDPVAVGIPESVSQLTAWAEKKLADFVRLTGPQMGIDFRRFDPLDNVIDSHGSRVVVQQQWRDVVQCHHQRGPLPHHVRTAPHQISWTMMEDGPLSSSATDDALSSSGAGQNGSAAPTAAAKPVSDSSLLQWVYGGEPKPFEALQFPGLDTSTSTANKACSQLIRALLDAAIVLKELDNLETTTQRLKQDREQMQDWSHIRREPSNPEQQLPSEALICMIRQEHTVTQAKLAINVAESHRLAKEQFKVNQRLAQAEAEIEHLESVEKAIERDARALHSNDEFASQQHKTWVAAQMQGELATKAKAKAKVLRQVKTLCKEKEDLERCIRRNEEEHSSLYAWEEQMDALVRALRDIMTGLEIQAATPGPWVGPGMTHQQLRYINGHFHKDIWPRLKSSAQIKDVYEELHKQHKQSVHALEQGCTVLGPLMAQVVEASCDDPAVLLLQHLVFPLVKERLQTNTHSQEVVKSSVKCFGEPDWDPTFSKLTQHYQTQLHTSPTTTDEAVYEASIGLMEFDEDFECGGNERRREIQGWSHSLFVDDICLLAHSRKDTTDSEFPDLLEVTKLHYIEPGSACLILLFCLSV